MKVLKWLDDNLEEYFLVFLLAVLTCVMMLQVILRYVFGSPLSWAEELCRYCFVYSVMIATPYCIRKKRMLRVDVIINRFPLITAKFLDLFAQLLTIFFCIILLKPAWNVMISAIKVGNVSSGLEMPMWILYTSAPLGFFLGIIRGIQVFIMILGEFKSLRQKKKGGGTV